MEQVNVDNVVSNVPTVDPAYVNLDYVFYKIFKLLSLPFDSATKFISIYKLIASLVAVLAIAIIIYCAVRLWEINKEAKEKLALEEVKIIEEETSTHTLEWQNVLDHAGSNSPSDWRLAILEADTLLESASQRLPVVAETLGERLKKLDKGDLRTLDSAWEAHKVRNRIAHDGFNFEITKHETLRIINLFEEVLRELGAIQK